MRRPRVVHVYKDVYLPVEGGIERTIYHLARLTKLEFEPLIITAVPGRGRGGTRTIDGDIEVIEVASLGRVMSTPLAPGFIAALRKSGADLFHFHLPHPTGEISYLLSGLKTPAVATYHSDIVRQKGALHFYGPFLDRFLKKMRVIMPTSQKYLDTSETLASVRDRCEVVPLGLPLEDYSETDATRPLSAEFRRRWGEFVFFIGVLRYYKGLHVLLEAMRDLPGAHLVIAGEGPERERLVRKAGELGFEISNLRSEITNYKLQITKGGEAIAPDLVSSSGSKTSNLEPKVTFLGRVDHPTAVALFHAASVFCLPATQRSEAFGLCQIEALACGVPIISTDLPTGVPEINRHEQTGLIVRPGDAAELAAAIRRLFADRALRDRLGETGRRRAQENYSAELMAERIMAVYARTLKKK